MKPDAGHKRLLEAAETDDPPTDVARYAIRLRSAGAATVALLDEIDGRRDVVYAQGRGLQVLVDVDWDATTASISHALEELVSVAQRFDLMRRLRFAESDLTLAASAADALIAAREQQGPARLFARVLETGLVVTLMRPYLDSNEAGVPRRFRPRGEDDRLLLDELEDLRNEYHAHAAHTARRVLIDGFAFIGVEGGPVYSEQWALLPLEQLREIVAFAEREMPKLRDEADRLEAELRERQRRPTVDRTVLHPVLPPPEK